MANPNTNGSKKAIEEFMDRLMKLEPKIGADEISEEARLYCRLCTVYCDMFGPEMKLTESNLTTL